jgi:ABC-type nitrate/sulfonate/bicarbonate transport system substrate-binding protein
MRHTLSFRLRCGLVAAFLFLSLPVATTAAERLRIGYGAPSIPMAVLWISQEGNLFARNGLEVEVLYLESALVQRALIAGNIAYDEMTGSLMAAPTLQGLTSSCSPAFYIL